MPNRAPGRPPGSQTKNKKPSKLKKQIQIGLPDDIVTLLQAEAATEGVFSLSTWCRMILMKHVRGE